MEDIVMNKDIIKGKWKEMKGKLQQQWGELTNDEIDQLEGNYDELEGLLQKKYGYQRDQVEKEIESFVEDNHWNR